MGSIADPRSLRPDDPRDASRPGVDQHREFDPGGRPVAAGWALRTSTAEQALFSSVDDRFPFNCRVNPRSDPLRSTLRSGNIPSARERVGDTDDALHDVGHPPRSKTERTLPTPSVQPKLAPSSNSTCTAADLARNYLALRRRRESLLGADLFADPAWDILLDLYASQAEGQNISVSSACLAGSVANTTALGWLVKLEQRGLISRRRDPRDGRRTFLTLSPNVATAIEDWLLTAFAC